jgi:hypothetical protein
MRHYAVCQFLLFFELFFVAVGGEIYTDVTKEIRDRLLKPDSELLGCDRAFVEHQLQVSFVSYCSKMRTMSKDDVIATDGCDPSSPAGSASLLKQLLGATSFSTTMERLWAVRQKEKDRSAIPRGAQQGLPASNPAPAPMSQRSAHKPGQGGPSICAWYLAEHLEITGPAGNPYVCKLRRQSQHPR